MAGAAKTLTLELTGRNVGLSKMLNDSGRQVDAFQKKVEGSNRSLSLSENAVKGAVAGVTALAAGLTYAISKAVAFDKAMRNVNSLTKLNESQFAAMEKQVISMSTKLPQSATTLAEGLYDIASSGFTGADGMKVLDAAARSASAGLTTTEVSAKAITAVLNAYGLQASSAADVSDVLFSTVNLGVISFEELAGNLGDVVGSAAAAKVSIDQVGAAIATMTLSGIKGAAATTALSSLTSKLVQPSEALADLYQRLGYESGAAALEQKGLRGVMEDVRKATGGNITAMLELFPDIEAARGALALMANDGANYAKVADQITDKSKRMGSTQQVLDEQMKSVSAQWQLMTNRMDAAAIGIGVKLLPGLLTGMKTIQDFGSAAAKFAGQLKQDLGGGVDALGGAVENVLPFLKDIGKTILQTGQDLGGGALDAGVQIFNDLAGALEMVTGFASENQEIVMALGLAYSVHALGGVSALNAGLDAAGAGLGALSEAGSAAYDFIAGLFTPRVEGAADSVSKLGDKAKAAGSKLKEAFMAAAPAASLGAALTVAVVAWQGYGRAAERADDITKSAQKTMNSFRADEMAAELQKANQFIDDYQARLREINTQSDLPDFKDLIQVGKNWETIGMGDKLEEVQEAATQASQRLGHLQYNTVELFRVMGQPLPDEAKWINDVQGANGAAAQAAAMAQMSTVLDQLGPKLREAGVDMGKAWDIQQMTNAYSALEGVRSGTDQAAAAQQNFITAMGGAAASLGDASDAADKLKSSLDALMGAQIGIDQAQIDWLNGLAELRKELKDNGDTLSLNSQKGRDNRQAIINQVQALQELLVAGANAGESQAQLTSRLDRGRDALIAAGRAAGIPKQAMVELLAQYRLTPELVKTLITESGAASTKEKMQDLVRQANALDKKKASPKISAETAAAQSRLNSVQNRLDAIDGRHASASVTVTENTYKNMIETTIRRDVGVRVNENGGLYPVNSYASGKLPSQAMIMPPKGDYGIVQWAEKKTEGEAFIPMAPSKRGRSRRILEEVADRFGLAVIEQFASGGFRYPAFKYPSFRYPAFKFNPKTGGTRASQQAAWAKEKRAQFAEYTRDRQAKYRDWERARYDAFEEYKERANLSATARGRGEGRFAPGMTASDTFGNLQSALEAQAQAKAELRARTSRSPSDSAEDYYKKPIASIGNYIASLKQAEKYQRQWNRTLSDLSSKVGADVVSSLTAMGEQGEAVIKKMATASAADMKRLADQIRRMDFANFIRDTTADVQGRAQFLANLQALVKMGRGDLAARIEKLGYERGAGIAAQAVKSPGSTLTGLNRVLDQQEQLTDPKLGEAFSLAQLIQRSGGKLGVMGLSRASGMPIGDVLGMLTRFEGQVFSKIPAAAMRQIRADQALLKAGKQPSGFAYGTIIRGSDTGYYWGEPSSGGESLIPHGIDRRQRALQLWRETGRILGAPGMGGGGISIASGAIQLQLTVTQAGASAQQIEAGANRVVQSALDDLARLLEQGRRG